MGLSLGHFGLKHTRDRLAGDRRELIRRREKLQAKIATLAEGVAALDAELQAKADEIQAIDEALKTVFDDQSSAEARQTFPKKHLLQWGGLARGVAAILREANGAILTTVEVADELASREGLELPTAQDARGFRRAIRYQLCYLARTGRIERLHALDSNETGQWRQKVLPE